MAPAPLRRDDLVFAGTGEMSRLCREFDWASTSLPVARGHKFRTIVGTNSPRGNDVLVGPDLVQIYNDVSPRAWRRTSSRPRCAGVFFAEIWPIIGPQIETVLWRRDVERRPARSHRATDSCATGLDVRAHQCATSRAPWAALVTALETTHDVESEAREQKPSGPQWRSLKVKDSDSAGRVSGCVTSDKRFATVRSHRRPR